MANKRLEPQRARRLKRYVREQMNKDLDIHNSMRPRRYLLACSIVACFSLGALVTIMAVNHFGPDIKAFGHYLRSKGLGEAIVGAIGGVVGGVALMATFGLVSFLPLFTIFWFFGPKCHACGKPLIGPEVGRTGRCRYCDAAIDPQRNS